MDSKYKVEHTRNWSLVARDNNLALYSYFDIVEWESKYAILDQNHNVLYTYDEDEHGNKFTFFEAVADIIDKIKLL